MTGTASARPRAHILLRVDRDCWPEQQWRLDCDGCGLVIGRGISADTIGDEAIAATLGHVCSTGPPGDRSLLAVERP